MPHDLAKKNVVHYFVYRDPRDVVISEAHYLREMNRWHRLAPYFRKLRVDRRRHHAFHHGLRSADPGT